MRIIKATYKEKLAYSKKRPRPIFQIYGTVVVDGITCVVEDLRGAPRGDPQYEVIAPNGKIFKEHYLHHLLCRSIEDACAQMRGVHIVDCRRPCDWCGLK